MTQYYPGQQIHRLRRRALYADALGGADLVGNSHWERSCVAAAG